MTVAYFDWDDDYSVGVLSIDRQHQVLIDYINRLNDEMSKPESDRNMLMYILNGLVGYTKSHFKYEEMLFELHEYPDTELHKERHLNLFERVAEFKARFDAGEQDVGEELLAFLKSWLNDHILKEDKAYSSHMLERNVR
jgi:hemerythrin